MARGIGADLCDALSRLGHPPSAEAAQRRVDRARAQEARTALRHAIAAWDEPWATAWAEGIASTGLLRDSDGDSATALADDVRRLLDHLDLVQPEGISRTEIAAALYGSAHALDAGTRRASAVTHALRHRIGPLDERELWEAAGIFPDRVSAPALVWSLPVDGASVLDVHIRFALHAGLPLHISLFALRRHTISVDTGTPVLVVENPRLVEAAAERSLPICVISSNGNPLHCGYHPAAPTPASRGIPLVSRRLRLARHSHLPPNARIRLLTVDDGCPRLHRRDPASGGVRCATHVGSHRMRPNPVGSKAPSCVRPPPSHHPRGVRTRRRSQPLQPSQLVTARRLRLPSRVGEDTAVYYEVGAGYPAREVGAEEHGGVADVFGDAQSTEGDGGHPALHAPRASRRPSQDGRSGPVILS